MTMMTTMNKLAELNVTIDFVLPMECYSDADYDAMDRAELNTLYSELSKEYYEGDYCGKGMSEERIGLFYDIDNYFSREDERKFHEYCTHMDEPDFDWGFYSDWHKDIYGYRPRW